MKIHRIVFNLGEYKMFVLCERNSFRKNISYEWKERFPKNRLPPNWRTTVQAELEDLYSQKNKPRL